MSAAQALTSGPLAPAQSARSSSGGAVADRGDAFRDTLETASRSSDAEGDGARLSPEGARGRKTGGEDARREGDESSARSDAAATQQRAEPTSVSGLSAMLAALGGVPAGSSSELMPSSSTNSVTADAPSGEAWPWFPGQVGEDGETLDAERLLALLKSSATSGSGMDAEFDAVDIKVMVAGQETHLALDPAPSNALAARAAMQDVAEVTTTAAEGNEIGKAATLGAALSYAVDGEVRRRSGPVAVDAEVKGEAARARGAAPLSVDWSSRALASLEHGIAGQEGRQSEGRGGSGAGSSQSQGTAAFMSALTGPNVQAAGAMPDAFGAGTAAEPVRDQIAAGVRAELQTVEPGQTKDGVVKVLHLELKPANLGSVTVRLALKDNAITIHLEAQRSDTLAIIEREREALVSALASAGYSVDGITAGPSSDLGRSQGTLAGSGSSGLPGSQGGHAGQAGQGQGFGNSSGGQNGSGQAGTGNSGYRHPSDDNDVNAGGVRRSADGVYV